MIGEHLIKKKLVEFKKFSIPIRGEEFIKKSIEKKRKDYKCDLKTMYVTKYKTKDALMKNRPSHIPMDQWIGLTSYWLSDKAKKRSQANRISRAKQKMPHTGGSKSIATLMNEKAIDGIEPTREEVYILTHTMRKDGKPPDEESSNTIVHDANSGNKQATQAPRMPSVTSSSFFSQGQTAF
ncbi:uncharacterized protein LOC107815445 isoform X2 [Nicotiana tabacum]|uniref:Uncharacterized protein LOC107815445 isoform X2 n=1 Tax=Nicotiana tabacum TaxID=4097 RepID=A0A1S4C6F8_TOBAC|nr:PREDICTED: uncharacterized protein LOC107815445 isoform X2 [Nicotiana tabacum]